MLRIEVRGERTGFSPSWVAVGPEIARVPEGLSTLPVEDGLGGPLFHSPQPAAKVRTVAASAMRSRTLNTIALGDILKRLRDADVHCPPRLGKVE